MFPTLCRQVPVVSESWHPLFRSTPVFNVDPIHASLKKTIANFDDVIKQWASEDVYCHVKEADLSTSPVSATELQKSSLQPAPMQGLQCQIRIVELKFVPAHSQRSSAMGSIPPTSRIENPRSLIQVPTRRLRTCAST